MHHFSANKSVQLLQQREHVRVYTLLVRKSTKAIWLMRQAWNDADDAGEFEITYYGLLYKYCLF